MIKSTSYKNNHYTAEIDMSCSDVFNYAKVLSNFDSMAEWCNQNFGGANWKYSRDCCTFYFKSEKHRTLFLLRWS